MSSMGFNKLKLSVLPAAHRIPTSVWMMEC